MKIEFKRFLRHCGHNHDLQSRGETRGLIYDYEVIDNGEKTAIFHRWAATYELLDREGEDILIPFNVDPKAGGYLMKASQAQFADVYRDAKANGRIPTAEQIAERNAKKRADAEALDAAQAAADRLQRIKDAGPELLEALTLLLLDADGNEWIDSKMSDDEWDGQREHGRLKALAAIAKARGETIIESKRAFFVDAQEIHRQHPESFEVPSDEELAAIAVGDNVKVCTGDERFWVEVTRVCIDSITGIVNNDLLGTETHGLKCGDSISFYRYNVYSIITRSIP